MREVREEDFRMPEFRNAKPEDYEFRQDGKLVRKDRWITAVQSIQASLRDARVMNRGDFEIDELVSKVKKLIEREYTWFWFDKETSAPDQDQTNNIKYDVRMENGSIMNNVSFLNNKWYLDKIEIPFKIIQWREAIDLIEILEDE